MAADDTEAPRGPDDDAGASATGADAQVGAEVSSVALVPVPAVQKLDDSKRGGVHVGMILEKARRRLHYSPEAVCRELGIAQLELDSIESGLRSPSPSVARQLAEFYGIDPERLDPTKKAERVSGRDSAEQDLLYLGHAVVNLTGTNGSNADVLLRMATTMRSIRNLHEQAPLTIRDDELDVISSVLDMEDPRIATDLAATFQLSSREAGELAARLRQASLSRKELPTGE